MVGRTPCRRNPRLAHAAANLLSPDDLLFGQNTGKKPSDVIVLRDGPLQQIPARRTLPVLRQLTLMGAFARAVRAEPMCRVATCSRTFVYFVSLSDIVAPRSSS